ncbi:MAG TPA: hypothetical protein VLA72_04015 [Anaerolineales bacterium]|nr:hypothetical protein [Anaerolineales bacterium]
MKNVLKNLTIWILVLILAGCGSTENDNPKSQSTFRENFSIGTVVDDNSQYLLPESRALSGSESGPPMPLVPFEQRQEEMSLQIAPADLPAFLTAVQFGIDEAITNSGATIVGRGSGGVTGTSFSISYREDDFYGVINIWGAQGEGTNYYLLMIITEGRD